MADNDEHLPDFPEDARNDPDTDVPTAPADPDDPDGDSVDVQQPLNPA